MWSLYELSEEIREVLQAIMDSTDESEVEELLQDLDGWHASRDKKLEGYGHVIRNSESTAKSLREEAKAFTTRAAQLETLSRRLKARAQQDMESHGETTVSAGRFTLRRQASPARVEVSVPVESLPCAFHHVTVKADKTALKIALEAGVPVEGAELIRGEHLRIRLK